MMGAQDRGELSSQMHGGEAVVAAPCRQGQLLTAECGCARRSSFKSASGGHSSPQLTHPGRQRLHLTDEARGGGFPEVVGRTQKDEQGPGVRVASRQAVCPAPFDCRRQPVIEQQTADARGVQQVLR